MKIGNRADVYRPSSTECVLSDTSLVVATVMYPSVLNAEQGTEAPKVLNTKYIKIDPNACYLVLDIIHMYSLQPILIAADAEATRSQVGSSFHPDDAA